MTISTAGAWPGAAPPVSAARKADLIFGAAQAELSGRLWQAALGTGGGDQGGVSLDPSAAQGETGLTSLLSLLHIGAPPAPAPLPPASDRNGHGARHGGGGTDSDGGGKDAGDGRDATVAATGLGANTRYLPLLASAAARTGVPAAALATIIDAEAAKGADGGWQAFSRNPRSSAAGLGQFLARTWIGMASASGTWLHDVARQRGWLDAAGHVAAGARPALLALRYDPATAIQGVADHARHTLDLLARAGFAGGEDIARVTRLSYLGHHLGVGDAIRFLRNGALPGERARTLLAAQIGASGSVQRIAEAGNPAVAHRNWLLAYLDRHMRPERFSS